MFIKLIQIYSDYDVKINHNRWHLREIVINKKYIINMTETDYFCRVEKELMPYGLNKDQKYTSVYMQGDDLYIVGDLEHIYKLLETDSALNHRQTLRG